MISQSHLKDVRFLEDFDQVYLDGESLSTDILVKIGEGHVRVKLTDEAFEKIKKARHVIDLVLEEKRSK
jgi:histidine ammonia-lyase